MYLSLVQPSPAAEHQGSSLRAGALCAHATPCDTASTSAPLPLEHTTRKVGQDAAMQWWCVAAVDV